MLKLINNEYIVEYKTTRVLSDGSFEFLVKTYEGNYYQGLGEKSSTKDVLIRHSNKVDSKYYENTGSKFGQAITVKIPDHMRSKQHAKTDAKQTENDEEYLKDFRVKYKIKKHNLNDLAESIKSWADSSSISDEAIQMMHQYLVSGYREDLTDDEIRDIIIYLLGIESEQYANAFAKNETSDPLIIDKPDKSDHRNLPMIKVNTGLNFYGQKLIKTDKKIEIGSSKIGGNPDLPTNFKEIKELENFHLIAQINTHEIENLPNNLQNKLISIFQSKNFQKTDYYKAVPAKVMIFDLSDSLNTVEIAETPLDCYPFNFSVFDSEIMQNLSEGEQVEWEVDQQCLTCLHNNGYAESLVTQSFQKRRKDEEWILPETIKSKEMEVFPLLKLRGSDLTVNKQYLFDSLTIVYFVPSQQLRAGNTDYAYVVLEPS